MTDEMRIQPPLNEFTRLAHDYNLVTVWVEMMADCETPVTAFAKLLGDSEGSDLLQGAFLLESAEKNDQLGRFSFLGSRPHAVFQSRGKEITITRAGAGTQKQPSPEVFTTNKDPLAELESFLGQFHVAPIRSYLSDPPPFTGGAVGYLGYDVVRFFEPTIPSAPPDPLDVPECIYMLTDTMVIFDHRHRRLYLLSNVHIQSGEDPSNAYEKAKQTLQHLLSVLRSPCPLPTIQQLRELPAVASEPKSNTTREEYEAMVTKGQEYIRAGDIFQYVPSHRFETPFVGDPLSLYRALRFVNPSPHMFCLKFGPKFAIVGSSPEIHVRVQNGKLIVRPLAGTRRRGADPEEDVALEAALLADPKERAEHLMLVDLGRNDLGRIAQYGSVHVTDLMTVERYSHVMHLVSQVNAQLCKDKTAFDAMRATFPAGTLSGAPKVRAMQIINEVEKHKRGIYAGAVGYFGFDGNVDSCIALRTVLLKDDKAYVQAGAGIVADSVPSSEYEETVNKAKGMLRAIELARKISEEVTQFQSEQPEKSGKTKKK